MVEIRDISEAKVSLIEENIGRSGLTNLRAAVCDALSFDPDSEEAADVVIADLPCSGLGIIGRKPDIKYNMTPEKLHDLACLQREILSVVRRYVKPAGRWFTAPAPSTEKKMKIICAGSWNIFLSSR